MAVLEDHASELVILKTRGKTATSDLLSMKIPFRCVVLELEVWMTIPLLFVIVPKSSARGRSVVIV